jgi:hypothetical protein
MFNFACKKEYWMLSGIRREADENYVLLGYCAVSSGNFLPTFQENLLQDVVGRLS